MVSLTRHLKQGDKFQDEIFANIDVNGKNEIKIYAVKKNIS